MDMWEPFRNATNAHVPQAAILFDKFHILRHLGEALKSSREERICSPRRRRPLHQGTKVHAAVESGESLAGRSARAQTTAGVKRLNTAYPLTAYFLKTLYYLQRYGSNRLGA